MFANLDLLTKFSSQQCSAAVDLDEDFIKAGEDANIAPKRGTSLISAKEAEEAKKAVAAAEEGVEQERHNGYSTASENEDEPDSRNTNRESFESTKANASDSEQGSAHSKSPKWHGFFKLLKKKSTKTGLHFNTIPAINVPKLTRKKSKKSLDATHSGMDGTDAGFCYLKSSWKNFSLAELQATTNNFSHGTCFRIQLPDESILVLIIFQ